MTKEVNFHLVDSDINTRVIRVQWACTVGDQHFDSTYNEDNNKTIRTSRLRYDADFSLSSIIATTLSISRYIVQFMGLRAMHWSVAITVLGATLIMACVRSYVRRGLAAVPWTDKLDRGREVAWVLMDALGVASFEVGKSVNDSEIEAVNDTTKERASALARKAVEVRKEFTQLVPWQDEPMILANQLAEAIASTLQYVVSDRHFVLDSDADPNLLFERNVEGEALTQPIGGADTVPFSSSRVFPLELESKKMTIIAAVINWGSTQSNTLRAVSLDLADSAPERANQQLVIPRQLKTGLLERGSITIEQDGDGNGNLFRKKNDSIDKAASSNLPNDLTGFTYYVFQHTEDRRHWDIQYKPKQADYKL
ncbi:uncharacterized protein BDV14DRAFT_200699 [Aspergillus stella-maris]|uniref:uncharacterized protein n=1 Tax=Aspergillus stella-maris TaxID=1810926 RepID=UPI003CCCAA7C